MTDRIALALAACEGHTNEELAQRGAGGFKYMIERKRAYARAARHWAYESAMWRWIWPKSRIGRPNAIR